ncbi:MAG: NAD(P)H-dependent oxidoreductase [Anaerolineaceae bacterium]
MSKKIAIIIGSLRKDSNSGRLAKAFASLLPEGYQAFFPHIGQLELYNADYDTEGNSPASYNAFREEMHQADAVIFVTPEHNRSVPAALKNALDIGSRPYGKGVWSGKPALVVSSSGGALGGFGANHHLRQSLVFLDMPVLAQPEAYIGAAQELVDSDGKIAKDETRKYFQMIVDAFVKHIERY